MSDGVGGRAVTIAGVELSLGSRILMPTGPAVVMAIDRHGPAVTGALGDVEHIRWDRLVVQKSGGGEVTHTALEPWWSSLAQSARNQALVRLEVVLVILTSYADGCPELAREGEPHYPYGDGFGLPLTKRVEAMARQLSQENAGDRVLAWRVMSGELKDTNTSATTLWNWIKAWRRHGLRGLVDGRKTKGKQGWEVLDARFIRIVDEELAPFDGTVSKVNLIEIERRIHVRLKQDGITDLQLPQRLAQQYLSQRYAALGSTARGHKGVKMRKRRGFDSYPDIHPGHLAVDVTRADNLVWDDVHSRAFSVEIITFISVPTRVVVACRVVPRSATAIDVAMALYDVMRPFSMVVNGTTIDDFRWCGIPASLDFSPHPLVAHKPALKTDRSLDGVHVKPGVTPKSIRADNGAIFISTHLREVLRDLGVDLLTSRVGHPTDNAHVERWHDTLQRAYQAIPGFKGRNVQERGRHVGMTADEPLLTARELEQHLHRFIALDYHRNKHDGIKIPGVEDGKFSPLEAFDMLSVATGRIIVPQHPDLIYQFLPIRWLSIGNAGVTYKGLTYDGPVVDELRGLRPGTFRAEDSKIPFFYDPRDRTRLWHRSAITNDRVVELRWRHAGLVDAPLTDVVVQRARQLIKARGGNNVLSRRGTMHEIIDAIGELTTPPSVEEWRTQLGAAALRHQQALIDHCEAAEARVLVDGQPDSNVVPLRPARARIRESATVVDVDEVWPDYDDVGD